MGILYFTRHGQTVWNVDSPIPCRGSRQISVRARLLGSLQRGNKICGATDIALTELGHTQAIELGRRLAAKKLPVNEILYSPLVRASETARHISEETGIPIVSHAI